MEKTFSDKNDPYTAVVLSADDAVNSCLGVLYLQGTHVCISSCLSS